MATKGHAKDRKHLEQRKHKEDKVGLQAHPTTAPREDCR